MNSIFPPNQLSLLDTLAIPSSSTISNNKKTSGSFIENMKLPIHRWFRYSAGFSANWVRSIIQQKQRNLSNIFVLDPFAGVGTTLLACDSEGVKSMGFETHPFIFRVAQTKLDSVNVNLKDLKWVFDEFYTEVKNAPHKLNGSQQPPLLQNCYRDETLASLTFFKQTYHKHYKNDSVESKLLWLAITAVLRVSSSAGTAQWQYVLPNKKKANVADPLEALKEKAVEIVDDIAFAQQDMWQSYSTILQTDSRNPEVKDKPFVDLVITSPPYPNNYDYADATRLEMTFWEEVEGWKDLQSTVRRYLIRSCSQHAAAERLSLDSLLSSPLLDPVKDELALACNSLAEIRLTKGGRKNYHTMAAAYFTDMAQIFHSLRRLCRNGSELYLVIGDSAPYGVYLHVDKWLGELALAAGFTDYKFEKIRDRNVKWKNRKHQVPLKEGRLWIKG